MENIQKEFPILSRKIHAKPLIYFDNAATSQKPICVIEAVSNYYRHANANAHRSVHTLAEISTSIIENTRKDIQKFINAKRPEEIIFTKSATEAINLIAATYGKMKIKKGDHIIISQMEHHANIVPWQVLAQLTGATLKVIPINQQGNLELRVFETLISEHTKLIAIVYASNTLGIINNIAKLTQKAHEYQAVVVVDGTQATSHFPVDVQQLDCDFLVFSAHKMYGPTGVGILYGKYHFLQEMPPYQTGGAMVKNVTLQETTYNEVPHKFEAGTPNVACILAFQKALQFIKRIGFKQIGDYEKQLTHYAYEQLKGLKGLHFLTDNYKEAISIISFYIENIHHLDVSMLLDAQGIAVRSGHLCTQPIMQRYNIQGVVRISFAVYNTLKEIDFFIQKLKKLIHTYNP